MINFDWTNKNKKMEAEIKKFMNDKGIMNNLLR
jgi:hypothetical protein